MNFQDRVLQIISPELKEITRLFQAEDRKDSDLGACCKAIMDKLRDIEKMIINNDGRQGIDTQLPDDQNDEDNQPDQKTPIDDFIDRLPPLDPTSSLDKVYQVLGHYFAKLPGPRFPRDEEYFARMFKFIVNTLSPADEFETIKSLIDAIRNRQEIDESKQNKRIEESTHEIDGQIRKQSGMLYPPNPQTILVGSPHQWEGVGGFQLHRDIDYRDVQSLRFIASHNLDETDRIYTAVQDLQNDITDIKDQVSSFGACCDRVQSLIRRFS